MTPNLKARYRYTAKGEYHFLTHDGWLPRWRPA